jgi:hypothetical protein
MRIFYHTKPFRSQQGKENHSSPGEILAQFQKPRKGKINNPHSEPTADKDPPSKPYPCKDSRRPNTEWPLDNRCGKSIEPSRARQSTLSDDYTISEMTPGICH